jgi:ribosomal protein S18 acetylase RimI-like enzyme
MTVEIRKATAEDVEGIAVVVQEVWKQTIEVDICHSQIEDDACAIWVAAENKETAGEVAGFVSAFLTVGKNGVRRWEVDLLAVGAASRGQQLGQKLVEATWRDAQRHCVNIARAAIRADNIASQRTFERAGYTTDGQAHKLLLWSPEYADGKIVYPPNVTLLPVDTVTYRGLWIEGLTANGVSEDEQRQTVAAARTLIAQKGRANTGAMIPAKDEVILADNLRGTAIMHGEYQWWLKPLEGFANEA